MGLNMELKVARKIARLSRQELAKRSGVGIDAIARIEENREAVNELPYRSVVHLAQALGVMPTQLFPVPPLLPVLPRLVAEEPAALDEPEGDDV